MDIEREGSNTKRDPVNDLIARRKMIERRFRSLHPDEDEVFFTTGNFLEGVKEKDLDPMKKGTFKQYSGGLIVAESGLFFHNPLLAMLPMMMLFFILMFMGMMFGSIVLFGVIVSISTWAWFGLPILLGFLGMFSYLIYMVLFQVEPRTHFFRYDEMERMTVEYREQKGRHFDLFTIWKEGKIFQVVTFTEMEIPERRFLDAICASYDNP